MRCSPHGLPAARNLRALSNCALDLDNHKHGCERPSSVDSTQQPTRAGRPHIDFRVTRDVPVHDGMHFEFIAQAFNLMNHTIISSVNTAFATQLAPTAPTGTCPGAPVPTGSQFA